jgi:hypothetical protein
MGEEIVPILLAAPGNPGAFDLSQEVNRWPRNIYA